MDSPALVTPRTRSVEDGFTLIEVIVALVLMSVVLMTGGGFMIRAMSSSSAVGGRQAASTVANEVLERVRAVSPTFDSTGSSPLVYGRGRTQVLAQWTAAAAAGLNVSGTYTGSGATSFDAHTYMTSGTPSVPFQQTIVRGSQNYTVDTLIGTCVRATASATCGKVASGNELFRVVVRVTWVPGTGKTCSGSPCSFVATTLIDPTQDPIFNSSRRPVANADSATVASGSSVDIGVTVNDSGEFALAGAVTIVSSPNATTSLNNNIVRYTPTSGFSGTNTFTYTVTDTAGRISTAGTVTVTVTPRGVNDATAVTVASSAVLVDVLANDLGSGKSLVSVGTPSSGSAVISSGRIRYTPPAATSGVATVSYTGSDSSGQQYTATLTVTVRPTSTRICWNGWVQNGSTQTRSLPLVAPALVGTGPFTIGSLILLSPTTNSTLSAAGTTLTYRSASNVWPRTFSYVVTDGNGIASTAVTMTLKATCP